MEERERRRGRGSFGEGRVRTGAREGRRVGRGFVLGSGVFDDRLAVGVDGERVEAVWVVVGGGGRKRRGEGRRWGSGGRRGREEV